MGKIIFLIVRPEVLIIISSLVLFAFKTHNIPAKKQNGKISNNIFGKFKELNIKIKAEPTFLSDDSFFPNSTVSPINMMEANSKMITPAEKEKF